MSHIKWYRTVSSAKPFNIKTKLLLEENHNWETTHKRKYLDKAREISPSQASGLCCNPRRRWWWKVRKGVGTQHCTPHTSHHSPHTWPPPAASPTVERTHSLLTQFAVNSKVYLGEGKVVLASSKQYRSGASTDRKLCVFVPTEPLFK